MLAEARIEDPVVEETSSDTPLAEIAARIRALIVDINGGDGADLTDTTPLVGEAAVVDSGGLLEIMLALEDFAGQRFGKPFDWMNDAAFSSKRSPFETIGALAAFMSRQMESAAS
jgi:acyl carrier protein